MKRMILAAAICSGVSTGVAAQSTTDRAEGRRTAPQLTATAPQTGSEPIAIAISDGGATIWSGTLKVGGTYGSASFSQSRNEAEDPCPGEAKPERGNPTSSSSINFSISRYNWQQEPDAFNVNLNWSRPIPICQGQGSDSFGLSRNVTLPRGQSVALEASGGVSIRLTRPR